MDLRSAVASLAEQTKKSQRRDPKALGREPWICVCAKHSLWLPASCLGASASSRD